MSRPSGPSAAARLHALRRLAQERHEDVAYLQLRYANLGLLRRLAASDHASGFLLKGATLFLAWTDQLHRPTLDIDLLGFGDNRPAHLEQVFRNICAQEIADDALVFSRDSVRAGIIREGQSYQGVRVSILGHLGSARLPLKIDIGFGDAVFPKPINVKVPGVLDCPPVTMRAYPMEAVVAEKLHALVALGMANSRMKDLFDLLVLSKTFRFDGNVLTESVAQTFGRRLTAVPTEPPVALTERFGKDELKQTQWKAFLTRSGLEPGQGLAGVVEDLALFALPVLAAASAHRVFNATWPPGGPWKAEGDAE